MAKIAPPQGGSAISVNLCVASPYGNLRVPFRRRALRLYRSCASQADEIWRVWVPIPLLADYTRYIKRTFKMSECKSGDYTAVVPPVPIPNTEVKYREADDSPLGESR